tara:strand:- start:1114 stop:1503 length:390 start_codon:yes stop_codon:yes gene_type:complete
MSKTVGARVAVIFILTEMIKQREIETGNIFSLIKQIVKIIDETNKSSKIKLSSPEKHDIVMSIILDVAKGKDGILGTSDDIIPPKVIEEIQMMKDTSLLSDCISLINDAMSKKKCNIPKCVYCVSKCWI